MITPRLGYGVGASLEDGSANIKIRRLEFQALLDFDFAESIRDSLDGSWTRTDDNEGYYVYRSNKMLSELVALGKIDSQITLKILTIDEEVMKSAVLGFFDADGGTSNKDDGSASVEAKNTNFETIKLVTKLLGQLKIHYRTTRNKHPLELVSPNNGRHYKKKTPYIHRIYIRRCCLHRFSAMAGFKIERKSKDLQEIIERIKFRHICPTV